MADETAPDASTSSDSWMNAGAAATGTNVAAGPAGVPAGTTFTSGATQAAQAALKAAQNPDRSQVDTQGLPAGSKAPQLTSYVPLALRPSRGGMLGVIDKMADAITGTTRPEIYKDDAGNEYLYHPNLTRGQQWERIGGMLMSGAAAGLAAGRGAGNMGKAAYAGVQVGQQVQQQQQEQEDKMKAEVRQNTIDRFNWQKAQMDLIESTFNARNRQVTADRATKKFYDDEVTRLTSKPYGGEVYGIAHNVAELGTQMHQDPTLISAFVKEGIIKPVTTFDENMQPQITFIKMPPRYGEKLLPPGQPISRFDSTAGKVVQETTSDGMTQRAIDIANDTAHKEWLDDQTKKQTLEKEKQQTQESKAKTQETTEMLPLKKEHERASTAQERASAKNLNAEAALRDQQSKGGPTVGAAGTLYGSSTGNTAADAELTKWPAPVQASVRGMLSYDVKPDSFPPKVNLKSPDQMSRETAVGIAKMIDPSFDEKKFQQRQKTVNDYENPQGTAGGAIVALNTAIHHAGGLNDAITKLDNHHWKALNWGVNIYKSQSDNPAVGQFNTNADGLAGEMATVFKKTGATQTEIDTWRKNMNINDGINNQRGNMDKALEMFGGRLTTLVNFYTKTMGRPPDFEFLDNQSKQILAKLPGGKNLLDAEQASIAPMMGTVRENPVNSMANTGTPAPAPAGGAAEPAPALSKKAWLESHPGGDINAAIQEAQRRKIQVID